MVTAQVRSASSTRFIANIVGAQFIAPVSPRMLRLLVTAQVRSASSTRFIARIVGAQFIAPVSPELSHE